MPSRTPPLPGQPSHGAGHPALAPIDRLARLLDSSIRVPGTGLRFGVDPLLGLVPGIGDAIGVVLSSLIIVQAARLGVPAASLARMVANVALEAVVGSVPLLGDLFDAGWKANLRNLRLLREHLEEPRRAARAGRLWVAGVLLVLLLAATAALLAGAILLGALARALGLA